MATELLGRMEVSDPAEAEHGQLSPWLAGAWVACGVVLLYVYRAVLFDLWTVWTTQQDYSHGLLVAPFAAYLIWRVRDKWSGIRPQPSWVGAGLLVAALLIRVVGVRCYYGSLERLSLIIGVSGLVALLGGLRVLRSWTGPLLFLLLMLPPPQSVAAAITLPLQLFAARASAGVLDMMGWEVVREGNVLRLPLQSLGVVEACNGLRMVFAIVTLGVAGVIGFLGHRPLWERLALLLSTVPLAIGVNVVRIVVTGMVSEVWSGHVSTGRVHDVTGWLMMPAALTVLWLEQRFLRRLFFDASRRSG